MQTTTKRSTRLGALLAAVLLALSLTFSGASAAWAGEYYPPPPCKGPYCPTPPPDDGGHPKPPDNEKPKPPDKEKPKPPDKEKPKKDKKGKKAKKGKKGTAKKNKCKGGAKAKSNRFLPGGPDVAKGGKCGAKAHSPHEGTGKAGLNGKGSARNDQGKGAKVRPGHIRGLR